MFKLEINLIVTRAYVDRRNLVWKMLNNGASIVSYLRV
jgi:hypothetical protein